MSPTNTSSSSSANVTVGVRLSGGDLATGNQTGRNQANRGSRNRNASGRSQTVNTLLWLLPLISVIILMWMIVLEMGWLDSESTFGIGFDEWFILAFLIVICCIIILGTMLAGTPVSAQAAPAQKSEKSQGVVIEAVPEKESTKPGSDESVNERQILEKDTSVTVEVEDIEDIEVSASSKPAGTGKKISTTSSIRSGIESAGSKVLIYPTKVGGGLYGDTYIKLDNGRLLKLRTLLFEEKYLY